MQNANRSGLHSQARAAGRDRRAFLELAGFSILAAATLVASAGSACGQTIEALLDAEGMVPVDNVVIPRIYRRQMVAYEGPHPPGTIVVMTRRRFLYLITDYGEAMRYGCGIGKQGFSWSGTAEVHDKQVWPDWYPPKEMRDRRPDVPEYMPGGIDNPLGARALYLYQNGRDTLYRIHGTREAASIGHAVSSGCVRLMNEDIIDLYERVPIGTRVVVT